MYIYQTHSKNLPFSGLYIYITVNCNYCDDDYYYIRQFITEISQKSDLSFCLCRGSEGVEFLLPFVAGFGNNHNSLDTVSNLNTTKSDWVLVYGSSKLSVIKQKDIHKTWTFSSEPIHR